MTELWGSSRYTPRAFRFAFLPASAFLQRVYDFTRHVALIVFGQYRVGSKYASRFQLAFSHDTLPFPKQIRDNALVTDRNVRFAVCHSES